MAVGNWWPTRTSRHATVARGHGASIAYQQPFALPLPAITALCCDISVGGLNGDGHRGIRLRWAVGRTAGGGRHGRAGGRGRAGRVCRQGEVGGRWSVKASLTLMVVPPYNLPQPPSPPTTPAFHAAYMVVDIGWHSGSVDSLICMAISPVACVANLSISLHCVPSDTWVGQARSLLAWRN